MVHIEPDTIVVWLFLVLGGIADTTGDGSPSLPPRLFQLPVYYIRVSDFSPVEPTSYFWRDALRLPLLSLILHAMLPAHELLVYLHGCSKRLKLLYYLLLTFERVN